MDDVIVSVRIPEKLLEKVKEIVGEGQYMDLSEGIRSIVRDGWKKEKYPELEEIKSIREEITGSLKENTEKQVMKEVISELKRIKEMVKKGEIE